MNKHDNKESFFNAVESLKKYRRADLVDDKGRNLLEKLYVDLLPNNHILSKCMKDNTTFLVGRKGTGKSTIFLRIEQELRKKRNYIPCYIDVKTLYESSQSDFTSLDYLSEYLDTKTLQKYLIERVFLQNVLTVLIKEVDKRYDTILDELKKFLGVNNALDVKNDLNRLKNNIENNDILKKN